MRKYISWALGTFLIGVFVVNTYNYGMKGGPEIGAFSVMALVIGATMFVMASDTSYNASVENIKRLDGVGRISIEEFYKAVAEFDTPLGKPWMGNITTVMQPCIIWGPNRAGKYVYAYKTRFTGSLYVSYNKMPSFIKPPKGEEWRMDGSGSNMPGDDYRKLICYRLDLITMTDDLYDRFLMYKQHRPIPPMPDYKQGTLYRFDENFRLMGQDFTLCDMDGNPIYKVSGTVQPKTFRICDAQDGAELMRMTKREFHILPHYDFHKGTEKIGCLHKCLDFLHNRYRLQTEDGVIEMQSVKATLGDNFEVHRNGEIIGTIAEKLNFTIDDLVLDNFVIHAIAKQDNLMLTALAVMIAGGQTHRRSSEADSGNDE